MLFEQQAKGHTGESSYSDQFESIATSLEGCCNQSGDIALPLGPVAPSSSVLQRWNASLLDRSAEEFVVVGGDNRLVSRHRMSSERRRVTVCAESTFQAPGVYYFVVSVRNCPLDHVGDPLELGVLSTLCEGGFRSVGYVTEGRLRGGAVFQDGAPLFLSLPGVPGGSSTLGFELTVPPLTQSTCLSVLPNRIDASKKPVNQRAWPRVRFMVDGEFVGRSVEIAHSQLPIIPVATLPVGSELEIVDYTPSVTRGQAIPIRKVPVRSLPIRLQPEASSASALQNAAAEKDSRTFRGASCEDTTDDTSCEPSTDFGTNRNFQSTTKKFEAAANGTLAKAHYLRLAIGDSSHDSSTLSVIRSTALSPSLAAEQAAANAHSAATARPSSSPRDQEVVAEVAHVVQHMLEAVVYAAEHAPVAEEPFAGVSERALFPEGSRLERQKLSCGNWAPEGPINFAAANSREFGHPGVSDAEDLDEEKAFEAAYGKRPQAGAQSGVWDNEQSLETQLSPGREVFPVGSTVLVAGRGRGVVLRILANRWRRVRLADGSEVSLKHKDMLELSGDGFAELEPPPGLAPAAEAAKEKARQELAAALAIVSMASDSPVSDDSSGGGGGSTGSLPASLALKRSGRGTRGARRAEQTDANVDDSSSSSSGGQEGDHGGSGGGEEKDGNGFGGSEAKKASWICCDQCNKWRRLPQGVEAREVCGPSGAEWRCSQNTWDSFNRCWVSQEQDDQDTESGAGAKTEEGGNAVDEDTKHDAASSSEAKRRKQEGRTLRRDEFDDLSEENEEPPLPNFQLVHPEELRAVEALGAEAVWSLPAGRLLCWVEDKGYAVTHAGETVPDVARDFQCEVEDMLMLNLPLQPKLRMHSILAGGSTLLVPWLENESARMWQELTTQLVADGWRLEWIVPPIATLPQPSSTSSPPEPVRRIIAYFPPPNAQALADTHAAHLWPTSPPNVQEGHQLGSGGEAEASAGMASTSSGERVLAAVKKFQGFGAGAGPPPRLDRRPQQQQQLQRLPQPPFYVSLGHVVHSFPGLLGCLDLACPATALERATRLFASKKARLPATGPPPQRREVECFVASGAPVVQVLRPIFSVGDWVLALWPSDGQWYFAKVTRRRELVDVGSPPAAHPANGTQGLARVAKAAVASYDVVYEDGVVERCKSPHLVREALGVEAKHPRGTQTRRLYWSNLERGWLAFWQGAHRVPGGPWSTLQLAEAALEAFSLTKLQSRPLPAASEPQEGGEEDLPESDGARGSDSGEEGFRPNKSKLQLSDQDIVAAAASPLPNTAFLHAMATAGSGEINSVDGGGTGGGRGGLCGGSSFAQMARQFGGDVCPACLEEPAFTVDRDALFESACCHRTFHKACIVCMSPVDLGISVREGGQNVKPSSPGVAVCPACCNNTVFHRQLRALKRDERFGGAAATLEDHTALIGREVTTASGRVGVGRALDRFGRLVLELAEGAVEKVRSESVVRCSIKPCSEFRVATCAAPPSVALPGATNVWKKAPASPALKAAEEAAVRASEEAETAARSGVLQGARGPWGRWPHKDGHPAKPRKAASSTGRRPKSSSAAAAAAATAGKHIVRGSGPEFLAPGASPPAREWACEFCAFLNTQFMRRCVSCTHGSQARSMVGRTVQTTSGTGVVAKSSGKGWVVVETQAGGSYRMRLSSLWDYTTAPEAPAGDAKSFEKAEGGPTAVAKGVTSSSAMTNEPLTTASGHALLPLPAQRVGDPGMPKNWSFSLLNKRVATKQGLGVVTSVIDKGWIEVRLDASAGGRRIKTRPGNVTALEGDDEVITAFAKKTKALPQNSDTGAPNDVEVSTIKRHRASRHLLPTTTPLARTRRQQLCLSPDDHGESDQEGRKRRRDGGFRVEEYEGLETEASEGGNGGNDFTDEETSAVGENPCSRRAVPTTTTALLRAVALERAVGTSMPLSPLDVGDTELTSAPIRVDEGVQCQLSDGSWTNGVVEFSQEGSNGPIYSVLLGTGHVEDEVPRHRLRSLRRP